jgi:hypothetical protein
MKSDVSGFFMKGDSFTTWSKRPTDIRLLPSHRGWGHRDIIFLNDYTSEGLFPGQ